MISTLARQLERHRDLLHVWIEQRDAIRQVLASAEVELRRKTQEMLDVGTERGHLERIYSGQYDALVHGLAQEHDRASAAVDVKAREVQESIVLEQETTRTLMEEESTNKTLRSTVAQIMEQLSSATQEMLRCQSAAMDIHREGQIQREDVPELGHHLGRVTNSSGTRIRYTLR